MGVKKTGEGCTHAWSSPYDHKRLHPSNAETEPIESSLARQTIPCMKRREVFGAQNMGRPGLSGKEGEGIVGEMSSGRMYYYGGPY